MDKVKLYVFILIIAILFPSLCYADDWSAFPIYPASKNVKKWTLFDGAANELFFEVEKSYPFNGVIDYYIKHISSPWVLCSSKSKGWQDFGDVSGKDPEFVHQYGHYWANFEKQRLLMLAVRYISKGSEYRKKPDNNIQNVYLVEYKEKDLQKALDRLSLKCENKKNKPPNKPLERDAQKQ